MTKKKTRTKRTASEAISPSSSGTSPDQKRQVSLNYRPGDSIEKMEEKVEIKDVEIEDTAPRWAKQMFSILCDNNSVLKGLLDSHKQAQTDTNTAVAVAQQALKQVDTLSVEVEILRRENHYLREKVTEQENYSKKYNLKIHNVPESPNEGTGMLLDKLNRIFSSMNINLSKMYVDNVHRIPSY